MSLKDLSPRAEPVGWAVIVGALLSALTSYGFNLTEELKDFILLVAPIALTALAARWAVYAPDTVKKIRDAAHQTHPSEPAPELPKPPGGDDMETPEKPEIDEMDESTWGIHTVDDDWKVARKDV